MLQPLARDTWLVAGRGGDASPTNRGAVDHVLVVRERQRVWLLGSGPSPAWARGLACRVREVVGRPVTDVVSPWPRPELVLGQAAFPAARHWAHVDVARAMATQCGTCVARLRERLGGSARDLGPDPVRVPAHRLRGAHGRLGPWAWTRLDRAADRPLTVWALPRRGLVMLPGLAWGGQPPDLRDADVAMLAASLRAASALADLRRAGIVVGAQGAVGGPALVAWQRDYVDALVQAVRQAQAGGAAETDAPALLAASDPAWSHHPLHALNWQRTWRQLEAEAFGPGPAATDQSRGTVQRSLR